jgi:hypothetical protein
MEQRGRSLQVIQCGLVGAFRIIEEYRVLASDDASFITASTSLVDGGVAGAYLTPE